MWEGGNPGREEEATSCRFSTGASSKCITSVRFSYKQKSTLNIIACPSIKAEIAHKNDSILADRAHCQILICPS